MEHASHLCFLLWWFLKTHNISDEYDSSEESNHTLNLLLFITNIQHTLHHRLKCSPAWWDQTTRSNTLKRKCLETVSITSLDVWVTKKNILPFSALLDLITYYFIQAFLKITKRGDYGTWLTFRFCYMCSIMKISHQWKAYKVCKCTWLTTKL